MGMVAKQPNGLYCRISTIVDAPTHSNMTEFELKEYLIETNQLDGLEVKEWLERYERPWEDAKKAVLPNNLTKKEIEEWFIEVAT